MKHPDPSRGFLSCFFYQLAIHSWWALIALILFILHFVTGLPWVLANLFLSFWGLHALAMTFLVSWGNQSSQTRTPQSRNKNPYSSKTEEFLPSEDDSEGDRP